MDTKDPRQMIKNLIHLTVSSLNSGDNKLNTIEIDSLTELCLMSFGPTGKEDPRKILSGFSDQLLTHFVFNLDTIKDNPMFSKICQFFVIEWCYRNDYLTENWKWTWESPQEGKVFYQSRVPLAQIPLPTKQIIKP